MFPNQDPEPLTKLNLDKPAEQEVAMVPAAESLQFRTAEMPDSSRHLCSVCNTGFDGEYYHLAGLVTCPKCARNGWRTASGRADGASSDARRCSDWVRRSRGLCCTG
jgi:hypothetical protein